MKTLLRYVVWPAILLHCALLDFVRRIWNSFSRFANSESFPNFDQMKWEPVGQVQRLFLYPCKSARPVELSEAKATKFGLEDGLMNDRSFLVVTSEGRMVTCRQSGKLATITPSYNDDFLTLTDGNGGSVRVNLKDDIRPDYIIETRLWRQKARGVDCGDEVAEWLTKVLFDNQKEVRLIYRGNFPWERNANKPKYFEFPQFKKEDKLYFADTSAYMIANDASLKDLNQRTSEEIPIENFRPNIVVKGIVPYDEDEWEYVKIGESIFRVLKPCERCISTCISLQTGERQTEPLLTLKKYRLLSYPERLSKIWSQSPIFGMNCGIDREGTLKKGDNVFVVRDITHTRWKIGSI